MNIQFLYSAVIKYITSIAVKGIIYLQDIYIAITAMLIMYKFRAIMYAAKAISTLDIQNYRLHSAILYTIQELPSSQPTSSQPTSSQPTGVQSICRQSANNITYQLRAFYMFDKILSVASLQRWLEDAQYLYTDQPSVLSIVYEHNITLYVARIDLDYDVEQISGKSIPESSIELKNLPRVVLYPLDCKPLLTVS